MRTAIVILCLLVAGVACGQDSGTIVFTDNIDTNTLSLDGIDSRDYEIVFGTAYDDPMEIPISIWWPDGRESESFTLGEIRALLERCKEFVRDNSDRNLYDISTTLEYNPSRDNPNRLDLARQEAEAAKAKVERLERETQLRRDIEEMIRRME